MSSTDSTITLWLPEPDVVLHQALGKLAEECGELSQILARCLIQGYDGSDAKTGEHNYIRLREEMADVLAAMGWIVKLREELDSAGSPRHSRKLDGFLKWQEMIEHHLENSGSRPLGWRIVNADRHTVMWDYDQQRVSDFRNAWYPGMAIEPMWSHMPDAGGQS